VPSDKKLLEPHQRKEEVAFKAFGRPMELGSPPIVIYSTSSPGLLACVWKWTLVIFFVAEAVPTVRKTGSDTQWEDGRLRTNLAVRSHGCERPRSSPQGLSRATYNIPTSVARSPGQKYVQFERHRPIEPLHLRESRRGSGQDSAFR
jgi:hypothetical protein